MLPDEEIVKESEIPVEENTESDDKKEESGESEGKSDSKPKKTWYEKRIDRFTAQNQSLVRTNEQLLQELTNLKSGKTEEGDKSGLSQPEIDRLVETKAQELIAAKEFNDKCNAVYQDGSEEFDDFNDAVKTLGTMGVMTQPFLDLVTDLDASHKVLYHLGTNPQEADRIQSLSPAKQALALAKLDASLAKPKKDEKEVKEIKEEKTISKAPPPVKTVDGAKNSSSKGWATKYYEGMPQAEFEEWDDKQSKRA